MQAPKFNIKMAIQINKQTTTNCWEYNTKIPVHFELPFPLSTGILYCNRLWVTGHDKHGIIWIKI